MTELLVLFAKVMPFEKIVEEIEQNAKDFRLSGNEESKKKLSMFCLVFCMKEAQQDIPAEKILRDMGQMERIKERMDSEKF